MSHSTAWQRSVVLLTLSLTACAGATPDRRPQRAPATAPIEYPVLEARRGGLQHEAPAAWSLHDATRDDYIAAALRAHPTLRAQFAAWQAARMEEDIVGALPEPQLRFAEFIEEVQTRTGPQQRRVGVAQRFPWPGTLAARRDQAAARARAESFVLADSALQLARRVDLAYLDSAFLARDAQVLRELLDLLTDFEPIVQARVRTGSSQEDLLRLQIEIGRLEDELAANQAQRHVRFAELLEASGREDAIEGLPNMILDEQLAMPFEREELEILAFRRSPSLARWEALYEAAIEEARLEDFTRLPSFVVSAETILTGDAPVAGVPGSGEDPWILSIGVDLPIWGSSYAAREARARERIAEARAQWDNAHLQLRTQIEKQVLLAQDAARRAELYRNSLLPRAEEMVQLSLASYRAGEASALDWIDAQRTLLALRRAYWRAQLDQQQAQVELRTLTAEVLR